MVFRFVRRRFFTNKKWVLLLAVYLVGVYYLANMLTRVVDRYDTSKHGGKSISNICSFFFSLVVLKYAQLMSERLCIIERRRTNRSATHCAEDSRT